MDELCRGTGAVGEIPLADLFSTYRKIWWKIALVSVLIGAVTLAFMFSFDDVYRSSAVLGPGRDDAKQPAALGALASLGVVVGGPASIEELESLFKSDDLAVRVFRKHDLWATVFADRYDPVKRTIREGFLSRLQGGAGYRRPTDWDAIRISRKNFLMSINRKAGTLSISFQSPSPSGSSTILSYFLEEAKDRLQEEALERAVRNRKFISDQIEKTFDPLTRDRLYSLLGQEMEREMMARNREQFGFRLIDSPRTPDRKVWPSRVSTAALATAVSFLLLSMGSVFFVRRSS